MVKDISYLWNGGDGLVKDLLFFSKTISTNISLEYNIYVSKKAEEIIKNVNATMSLEGLPLTDFDIDLISKVIDGELTREEAITIFNRTVGING